MLSWSQLQGEDDCALMQQLVAGNDDALAVIVDRYQRLVLSVALRIVKDVSEAEEVAQTVFQHAELIGPETGAAGAAHLHAVDPLLRQGRQLLRHRLQASSLTPCIFAVLWRTASIP